MGLFHRIVIMALAIVGANAMAEPAQTGQMSVLTIGRTHLLVTASGNGHFVWELRRWFYRDAMAPPAKKLYHRIRTSQEVFASTACQFIV